MRSKIGIAGKAILLFGAFFILFTSCKNETEKSRQYAAMSIIKCTPAKFLLEPVDSTSQISPLFENLGDYTFSITSNEPKAQQFFNQGLKLTFAFNHAEAHRSFLEAARLEPNAAMNYWGIAYALGPNINDWFPPEERQALIKALNHRYSEDTSADRKELNIRYLEAMTEVKDSYPDDPDILTLYAAAAMNTVPWDYWDTEGNPSPNIPEAKAALEKAIALNPDHPGAHHYYIHMVELPLPDLGVPSAEKLGALMPSAGHLVHMPSHIYIRVGRYKDAVIANQAAILADEDYISQCYSQGMYPLGYYPHNIHFLWSASSFLGASEIALDAAKKTAEKVPAGELNDLPFLQDFASTPLLSYVRFGKWNSILTTPSPADELRHFKLIWHYARGLAFIRKENLLDAKEELAALKAFTEDETLNDVVVTSNNSTLTMSKIAYEIVAGEYDASKGEFETAIAHLNKAVELEDGLTYTEPSSWHIPTRQTLGSILLNAKKYKEAETVYREDLEVLRQNGWSLIGLTHSLYGQGKVEEALVIKQEFDEAWKDADIAINNSVF
jgi:tetratricopeptide (TPR) repeat protein